jgi:hypothetical protein
MFAQAVLRYEQLKFLISALALISLSFSTTDARQVTNQKRNAPPSTERGGTRTAPSVHLRALC